MLLCDGIDSGHLSYSCIYGGFRDVTTAQESRILLRLSFLHIEMDCGIDNFVSEWL